MISFKSRLLRRGGADLVVLLPGLAVLAFLLGGGPWVLAVSVLFPLLIVLLVERTAPGRVIGRPFALIPDAVPRFRTRADNVLRNARDSQCRTACLIIGIDDADATLETQGPRGRDQIMDMMGDRLLGVLRDRDMLYRLDQDQFGVLVAPVTHLDLDASLTLAGRLQAACEDPFVIDERAIYLSASVGLCASDTLGPDETDLFFDRAKSALAVADAHGPAAIRHFAPAAPDTQRSGADISQAALRALENGEIQPWFQPQVSAVTGRVIGLEALARWCPADGDMVPPADFLPLLRDAGRLPRLCEVMIFNTLSTLKQWDTDGIGPPTVSINFAPEDLSDPKLIDKINWELDRFDLTPDRLVVEVLETVIAETPDDVVARNINGLAELGCGIDLDDFGTGHASISSIRRFAVSRIKIDRSFVTRMDRDTDQQRLVAAIVVMADKLGLETIAEGVETPAEHDALRQLGCSHLQGFGIARPMPKEETGLWLAAHQSEPPRLRSVGA